MRRGAVIAVALLLAGAVSAAAAPHEGRVAIGGVPVPGATVTAIRGDRQVVTATDDEGIYRFASLQDGTWTLHVEMRGFSTLSGEITVGPDVAPAAWELTLLPFQEMARGARVERPVTDAALTDPPPPIAERTVQERGAAAAPPTPDPTAGNLGLLAADGFLINGSVNNAAASPFAQLRAFGNNRPGQRSLYNWSAGLVAGHSAWDARPFSFANRPAPKPDYSDLHVMGTFGGPLRLPRLRSAANTFVGYQRLADHHASTQTARVPTAAERSGVLAGGVVPADRISAPAQSLLGLYPLPNLDSITGDNYQTTTLRAATQQSAQARITQPLNPRNQLAGTFAYQHTSTDATNLFGFENDATVSGVDTSAAWTHRLSAMVSLRLRYQMTSLSSSVTPFFANRLNVSGEAGIAGNNQEPAYWGPPSLVFSNGFAGLSDAEYASTATRTHAAGVETFLIRGRHTVTIGGTLRSHAIDIRSQQNPRGTFVFTGSATGDAFGDFLVGRPHASAIAFGSGEKRLRHSSYDLFVSDDWRVSPSLTVNAGVRWEYEAPITEKSGHLANLDIAPGFDAAAVVTAADPVGTLTGARYPRSLLRPDRRGVQPRVGMAWRPVPGSSLVIRAGYGVYRNTSVYQSIAALLAEQPPFSTALSVETSTGHPLTLADGFPAPTGATPNTFAVDPDFRVGYAHNWQVSVQRDMPISLTVTATYLGTSGRRLMQQTLPNTYPAGAVNPCLLCPSGFVYLTTRGRSDRHAAQLQVRRRLRSGLAATLQYTLAKANDDAAAFGGASLAGATIAQDWTNLDAEYAPSNFDQRHLLTLEAEYTTGVGLAGGALMQGLKGRLFKGWTFSSQLTAGSGRPLTPGYLRTVAGTGFSGTIRPSLTGEPLTPPPGMYLNPAAYRAPGAGEWGNAGRNSLSGPSEFSFNGGVSRTFLLGDRLSLDWRIDATNLLNRVTYAAVDTTLGSPQFGRPNRANTMRKLQTTVRLRF